MLFLYLDIPGNISFYSDICYAIAATLVEALRPTGYITEEGFNDGALFWNDTFIER